MKFAIKLALIPTLLSVSSFLPAQGGGHAVRSLEPASDVIVVAQTTPSPATGVTGLQVLRVLKGDVAPGATLSVNPVSTGSPGCVSGSPEGTGVALWFLKTAPALIEPGRHGKTP